MIQNNSENTHTATVSSKKLLLAISKWSFRHPMGFKDFPDIWKSNYGEEQEL